MHYPNIQGLQQDFLRGALQVHQGLTAFHQDVQLELQSREANVRHLDYIK